MDQIILDDAGVQLRSNKLIVKSNIFFMPPLQIFYESITQVDLLARKTHIVDKALFMSYFLLNGVRDSNQHIILSTRNLEMTTFNCQRPEEVYNMICQRLRQCRTFNMKYKKEAKNLLHVMNGLPRLDFRRVK